MYRERLSLLLAAVVPLILVVSAIVALGGSPASAAQGGAGQAAQEDKSLKIVRTDYDMAKLAAPVALAPDELEGRRVFLQKCLTCHERSAPALDREALARIGDTAFRDKTLKGSRQMPGFQYAMETTELDQIVAYLKTAAPTPRPTPPARTPARR